MCREATEGGTTHQSIPQRGQLNKVHDLIYKGVDDFVGLASGAQAGAEQQGFPDSGLRGVHIKLLHIAADTGKGGLLLGVAIHHDVALYDAPCSCEGPGSQDGQCREGMLWGGVGTRGGGRSPC